MLQLFLIIIGVVVTITLTLRQAASYSEKLLLVFGLLNSGLIYLKGHQTLAILYIILCISTIILLTFWKHLQPGQTVSEPQKLGLKTSGLALIFLIGTGAFVYLILTGYNQLKVDGISPVNQSLFALLLAGILLSFIIGLANLKRWYS